MAETSKNNNLSLRLVLVFLVGLTLGLMSSQAYSYWTVSRHFLSMSGLTKKVSQFVDQEMFKGKVKVQITEMQPMKGVAKFKIKIPGQNNEYTSYVTRDGNLLFPSGVEVKFSPAKPTPKASVTAQPTKSATPSSKSVTPTGKIKPKK